MLQRTSLAAVMISMSMAACGGGGSDETAVSANPPAPVPSPSPSAAPAPGTTPAAGTVPAPVGASPAPVGASPTPAPSGAPAAGPVAAPAASGLLVWAALEAGVSPSPNPEGNPYTNYRKVSSPDGSYYFLGGAMTTHVIGGGFPNASGLGLTHVVTVEPQVSNGVITGVTANGLSMEGPTLDLRSANLPYDRDPIAWTNGQYSVKLLVQSVSGQPDSMRVCWDAHLPPPTPVAGPPGFVPQVRSEPFRRLMCGVYSNKQSGPDRGGYVIDDFGGKKTTYTANW